MTNSKSILTLILGNKTNTNPEIYFLRTTFLSASIFLFVLIFIHLLMNLKMAPVYFAGGSSLLMLFKFFIFALYSALTMFVLNNIKREFKRQKEKATNILPYRSIQKNY
jgi:hypothetical protein